MAQLEACGITPSSAEAVILPESCHPTSPLRWTSSWCLCPDSSRSILGLQQGFHLSFCCWVMIFVLNTQQGWCMEASFLTSAAQCGISPLLPEVHTLCKENCTPQWYLKSWGSFQVLVPHIKEESPNILTCTND